MRPIDADALISFIDMGHLRNPLEACYSERVLYKDWYRMFGLDNPLWRGVEVGRVRLGASACCGLYGVVLRIPNFT